MTKQKNTLQLAISNIKNIDDDIFKILVALSVFIIVIGVALSVVVFLVTGIKDRVFYSGFCLTSNCLQNFKMAFSSVLDILATTGVMLGGAYNVGRDYCGIA